ncbi:MAG: DUF1549 and DUF1553 domain-containing protein, partial [Nevskia sp.]|nr:DUF1549 and DUF1553 domain-containing protein [Nevskia sp.]
EVAAPKSRRWWSYQPVQEQAVPVVKDTDWVRTPIDAFVLARLEAQDIKPSRAAGRAAYIRRATLDVWGVIPTPEQVQAFVDDDSPDAYEKLADRLLSSPHYGERQARRWLDLARYADSTGFQNDTTRPNAWRYRDYVITAFNQNKPYDQFVKEQIAGDEIDHSSTDDLIATGFLANYPDNYNARDLTQRKYQITTDMADTVGTVFLAQSVQCARCHDHKFDRISQKDYFQFQAFFANTSEEMHVAAPDSAQVQAYKEAKARYEAETKSVHDQLKAVLAPVHEAAIKYQKERYLTDSREAIFKPESQWNALDRWINHRWSNVSEGEADEIAYLRYTGENKDDPSYTAENGERWEKVKALQEQLKASAKLKPAYELGGDQITAMDELGHPDAPATFRLFGGAQDRPLEEVQPAFPEAIAGEVKPDIQPTATSSGRRLALARWIASADNPLTARVFVNRVWAQYFGTGIVPTVSDFGRAGQKPSSPELLDYLAYSFEQSGWDVKKLHRQILLSSVYRQSSDYREDVAKADPENKLLAVFPRRRLDAEEIRDSLLLASGRLNEKVGGPSVLPPLPKGLASGKDFGGSTLWTVSKDQDDWNRRSLYIFTRRSVAYPMLATFDMADPSLAHSKRNVTTTPLQALTLYNDEFVYQWSQDLAGEVLRKAGDGESDQVALLYQVLFARKPDRTERATIHQYLQEHQKVIAQKAGDGKLVLGLPVAYRPGEKPQPVLAITDPIRQAAFVDLVHTVVNSNEFVYKF